tara:strand:- start:86370 stop:86483 length:114 start_codon:yes stop_codon:yes gene_type:complete
MNNLGEAIEKIVWLEGEVSDLKRQLEELKIYVDQVTS